MRLSYRRGETRRPARARQARRAPAKPCRRPRRNVLAIARNQHVPAVRNINAIRGGAVRARNGVAGRRARQTLLFAVEIIASAFGD